MKKGIIIILSAVLVVAMLAICITIAINSANDKVFAQEDGQFEILFKEYSKIIAGEVLGDVTIVMDESTYTNFITGEKFSQEHIDRIKGFEITGSPDAQVIAIVVSGFNSKDKSVIVNCYEGEHIHQTLVKFTVKNGKLVKSN